MNCLERVADAEPGGDEVARLHPAEDPGDGAEVGHGALPLWRWASLRLAGREPMRACSSSATGVACSK